MINKILFVLRLPQVIFLVLVTFVALQFVPAFPLRNLDDPSHWGVLGFVCVAAFLALCKSWDLESPPLRWLFAAFLVALPTIYVANWLRWGGSEAALWLELFGLAFWTGLAVVSLWRKQVIWIGVALHAVWDATHFGHSSYVPDWYIVACIAADIGLAGFLLAITSTTESDERQSKDGADR
ncbi:hypothetical protein [Cognatishimia sp. MH4019]|uniref:hypothetical protein n=1 Tax=Cognatishimia sp. MH4019 TaxID=2854030 RepID=UPI001CD1F669|nr:hypothetical protein [Cognatishimia sp. MH4019]